MLSPTLRSQFSINFALISIKNFSTSSRTYDLLRYTGTDQANWYLGYLYALDQNPQAAIEIWTASPGAVDRLIWLGRAANRQKDFERALKWFDYALQLSPEHAEGRNLQGDTLVSLQRWEAAQAAYQTAIRFSPATAEYYVDLANMLIATQTDLERAESLLKQAVKLTPPSEDLYRALAGLAEARGDLAQAMQWWGLASSIEGASVDTLLKTGSIYERMGIPERAVEVFLLAVQHSPTSPAARTALANAYFEVGDWDRALEEGEQVLAQTPQFFDAWLVIGKAHLQLGQLDEALEALTQASGLKPDHPEVIALLNQLKTPSP